MVSSSMLAQITEALPPQLWEQPGTVVIVVLVLGLSFAMFGWQLRQNASERQANTQFVTSMVTSALESQRETAQAIQRLATAVEEGFKQQEERAEKRFRQQEERAEKRFEAEIERAHRHEVSTVEAMSSLSAILLERKGGQ